MRIVAGWRRRADAGERGWPADPPQGPGPRHADLQAAPRSAAFRPPDGLREDRWHRARDYYHAVLVANLQQHGASTTRQLAGSLRWFEVELTADEVVWLVDSARRHSLVAPLGVEHDARGTQVTEPEWIPTETGGKLRRPRTGRLEDWREEFRDSVGALSKLGTAWRAAAPVVVPLASLAGVALLSGTGRSALWPLGAAVGLLLVLAVAAYVYRLGARSLHEATLCWPRLRRERPDLCTWVAYPWRRWACAVCLWLLVALLCATGIVEVEHPGARGAGGLALASGYGVLVMSLLQARWMQPARRSARAEHGRLAGGAQR